MACPSMSIRCKCLTRKGGHCPKFAVIDGYCLMHYVMINDIPNRKDWKKNSMIDIWG